MPKTVPATHEHEIERVSSIRKQLTLYHENGNQAIQIPFYSINEIGLRIAISRLYKEAPYCIRYKSTDRNSGETFEGCHVPWGAAKIYLRAKRNRVKRRVRGLLAKLRYQK